MSPEDPISMSSGSEYEDSSSSSSGSDDTESDPDDPDPDSDLVDYEAAYRAFVELQKQMRSILGKMLRVQRLAEACRAAMD